MVMKIMPHRMKQFYLSQDSVGWVKRKNR